MLQNPCDGSFSTEPTESAPCHMMSEELMLPRAVLWPTWKHAGVGALPQAPSMTPSLLLSRKLVTPKDLSAPMHSSALSMKVYPASPLEQRHPALFEVMA